VNNAIRRSLVATAVSLTALTALAVPVSASTGTACKDSAYQWQVTSTGGEFRNQGECVAYLAGGGTVTDNSSIVGPVGQVTATADSTRHVHVSFGLNSPLGNTTTNTYRQFVVLSPQFGDPASLVYADAASPFVSPVVLPGTYQVRVETQVNGQSSITTPYGYFVTVT